MCCFNKVNLSAILSVHKRIMNKDRTVKNNNAKPKDVFLTHAHEGPYINSSLPEVVPFFKF
jgi:hypothetical protein